jgi:signal transduction histidine kinase
MNTILQSYLNGRPCLFCSPFRTGSDSEAPSDAYMLSLEFRGNDRIARMKQRGRETSDVSVVSTPTTRCVPPPLVGDLADRLRKTRQYLIALTVLVVFSLMLIGVHESIVLVSPPVPFRHQISHFSLLAIGISVAAGLWAFWASYRSLCAHQRLIADGYQQLDRTIHDKTQDLIASTSLLESLFDAVEDRMVVINGDGTIVRANRTAIADAGDDPCGKQFNDAFPDCGADGERRSELRIVEYTFRTRMPQRNRLVKGGRVCGRVLEINTFPVLNKAEEEVGLVIELARDVTNDKENQVLANHYEKMAALGLLAAGIAHDLGNPLASLSSELQMLGQEESIERIRQSLQTLERHIERMARSVRDILGFAQKRSDRSGRASLHSTVEDAMRLLRHDPRAKSVRFEVDVPQDVPYVTMKEDDLVLILLNVIVNAVHAMPQGGQIKVYSQTGDRGDVALKISDTGTGMDANTLARAAQPLFTTKPETEGTGLGLAIASTLIHRVNGTLSISSVPGKGTTVTLRLPLQRPPEFRNKSAGASSGVGSHSDY